MMSDHKIDPTKLAELLPDGVHWGDTLTPEITRAVAVAAVKAERERQATRQYYYKHDSCKAVSPRDPDCICWRDEGTGPMANSTYELEWRDKPTPSAAPVPEQASAAVVELTDDEIEASVRSDRRPGTFFDRIDFARAVIAAHEKKQGRGQA